MGKCIIYNLANHGFIEKRDIKDVCTVSHWNRTIAMVYFLPKCINQQKERLPKNLAVIKVYLTLCIAILKHHFCLRENTVYHIFFADQQQCCIRNFISNHKFQITQSLLVRQRYEGWVFLLFCIFSFQHMNSLPIQIFNQYIFTDLLRKVWFLLLKNGNIGLVIHWFQLLSHTHKSNIFKLKNFANRMWWNFYNKNSSCL